MSLNQISNYSQLYEATEDIFVSDCVFNGDLNINMSRTSPINPAPAPVGSYLVLNASSEVTWSTVQSLVDAELTNAVFGVQTVVIDSTDTFKTVPMTKIIESAQITYDALRKIFIIPNTVKGVFLVFANYTFNIPGNGVCYEIKPEFKISPDNDNPDNGYDNTSRKGLLSTTVFSDLDNKFLDGPKYNFITSFVFDTYTTGLNNTYVRLRCRKQNSTMEDGRLESARISVIRIS